MSKQVNNYNYILTDIAQMTEAKMVIFDAAGTSKKCKCYGKNIIVTLQPTTKLEHFQTFVHLCQISFLVFIRVCPSSDLPSHALPLPLFATYHVQFSILFCFNSPIPQHVLVHQCLYNRSKGMMGWYTAAGFQRTKSEKPFQLRIVRCRISY
ncbi:hypothetical protein LOAG_12562 [Loa loa]|uniref:Uncharacterized protein n=1 Tax=Loa loa TaxID=7209 RepID=A0A1S0TLG6_LOALO|nr:hypothetical protein LOAG_12562 [Loa loa]EFO15944.1 hypothetical protein LOAG_12562 [Loa loa]